MNTSNSDYYFLQYLSSVMMEAIGQIINPGYKMQWDWKDFGDMSSHHAHAICCKQWNLDVKWWKNAGHGRSNWV